MRLLNVTSLDLVDFHPGDQRPSYVIASHRWINGFEVTFDGFKRKHNADGLGRKKIEAFAEYIRNNIPSVEWLWIDTCCINKDSTSELSESINLMFDWYRSAELCIAWLSDVKTVDDRHAFEHSEWFTRGWTLQELLAPRVVLFLTEAWEVFGHKGATPQSYGKTPVGPSLESAIARIIKIPEEVLHDYETSLHYSRDEKLKWMEGRSTTREEDMSYALYGIFEVSPGVNYGEKGAGARQRLLAAIAQREDHAVRESERFERVKKWISPPDPWANHKAARDRHEPGTCVWLLESNEYKAWKSRSTRHLWVHGKVGCGKTVLSSTAIEDIRTHYKRSAKIGQAVFYFSFSDRTKQTFVNLVSSLVIQLGFKEPALSSLMQAYHRPKRRVPNFDEMENLLLASIASYDDVFLHLDGLDECPSGEVQSIILGRIESLLKRSSNLRMLATSRDVSNVRSSMERLGAQAIPIATEVVDMDIRRYVATQLKHDSKLSRLDPATRGLVQETFAQKANGMFRWAFCQLQELKKSKSTKPSRVKSALFALPATLDETYERCLTHIHEEDRVHALMLLRWLAYAKSPPTLIELAEATIIFPTDDPNADGVVDTEDRGSWLDALYILGGLVVALNSDQQFPDHEVNAVYPTGDEDKKLNTSHADLHFTEQTRIRLAHFSVKEYLESSRILETKARDFHLDRAQGHAVLAQSCLVYLNHYSNSPKKTSNSDDLQEFPLLDYAANSWFHHAKRNHTGDHVREVSLLTSDMHKQDWIRNCPLDRGWLTPARQMVEVGPALYYASLLGLKGLAELLLDDGADVNESGGYWNTALQAASFNGHIDTMKLLLANGADVNAQGGVYGNALQAAAFTGPVDSFAVLLDAGADVNAEGGSLGSAVQAASFAGHIGLLKLLIKKGANINAFGGMHRSALQAAMISQHEKTAVWLIKNGADVNGDVLKIATEQGCTKLVKLLLEHGARPTDEALQIAARDGHGQILKLLLEHGADANANQYGGTLLQSVSYEGRLEVVKLLIEAGADVNTSGGFSGGALPAAAAQGHTEIVRVLLSAGVDVNAVGGTFEPKKRNALWIAAHAGFPKIVALLLEAGADIDGEGGEMDSAVYAAQLNGHVGIVKMLHKHIEMQL